MSAYADTSFLISLYTPDVNSGLAAAQMRGNQGAFLFTTLCELELTNALQLRIFRRELTRVEAKSALAAWEDDIAQGVFWPAPMALAVYESARQLVRKHTATLGTRTLDILHVAAALHAGAEMFYTFDKRQHDLAHASGLRLPMRLR